jgi:hypothetical protein
MRVYVKIIEIMMYAASKNVVVRGTVTPHRNVKYLDF